MSSTVTIPEAVQWTSLEKLALVSAVAKKGENNWPTISRLVRPYVISPDKNIELFSAKNCALKYDFLVEQVEQCKHRNDPPSQSLSTAEQVLKLVTAERIAELKEKVKQLHANCTQLHVELNEVNSGKYNSHIEVAWDEVQKRKHSQQFHPLATLVADILTEKKTKQDSIIESMDDCKLEPKLESILDSTKIKEEVLDEGHSSPTTSKSDISDKTNIKVSVEPSSVNSSPSQRPASQSSTLQPTAQPTNSIPSCSPVSVSSSPNRGPRLVPSPRLQTTSRIVPTKTKLPESDKTKVKTIKPQKKKPVVPKIKIKALQMAVSIDPKSIVKGDKKENKITDVFHFDYQPPSGSGSNPNAQYSSLYQDPKMITFHEKQESRTDSYDASSSPASSSVISCHSQNMSPRVDPETIDTDSATFRSWKKSILLLWKTAAQHKYAHIFMNPVTDELAPGYSATVRRPIDMSTIRRKIDSNEIRTTAQFHRDVLLMFHNAIMYNNASHSVYTYTVNMMTDIVELIQAFYSTHNPTSDKHIHKVLARSRTTSIASQ